MLPSLGRDEEGSEFKKKPTRKKQIEPNPAMWRKPPTMGDMEVNALNEHKSRILNETKNVSSFVVIGQTLHKLYYEDKLMKTQKEFLEWTKAHLGFSKSTTYEYIISYRIYSDIASKLSKEYRPPMYQSHCQLLSKVPSKKLVETWVDVCRQAPNGVITTAFLEAYLEKHNLKVPKSRIAAIGHGHSHHHHHHNSNQDSEATHYPPHNQAGPSNLGRSGAPVLNHGVGGQVDGLSAPSPHHPTAGYAIQPSKPGKHAREEDDDTELAHKRRMEGDGLPVPVNVPPPLPHAISQTNDVLDEDARPRLPFNDGFIFELSKNVVIGSQFDMVMQTIRDFKAAEQQSWFGRLWCNLSGVRPFSTSQIYGHPANPHASFDGGLERLLQIIFTKFANKEFVEGLFLLKAEFGADWFTPILQHPYCILRHNNPPIGVLPAGAGSSQGDGSPSQGQEGEGSRSGSPLDATAAAMVPMIGAGGGQGGYHPYESYVMFYLGPNIKEFCTVFRSVGLVPGINSW